MKYSDVHITTRSVSVRTLVDQLRNHQLAISAIALDEAEVSPAILEFLPTSLSFPLVLRPDWATVKKGSSPVYDCYCGAGLLQALSAYIIYDEVMIGTVFDDWEGKRFSELEPIYQNAILDRYIDVCYDESPSGTRSAEVAIRYTEMLKYAF